MKTSKLITVTFLNLVLFMSVSSIAMPLNGNTGDIVKTGAKKQIGIVKNTLTGITSGNEFRHLRFDVTKFSAERGIAELPMNSLEYLRFNVNNFSDATAVEITELPVMNEFDYLRFNVNEFVCTDQLTELPVNEFEYLRFDASKFSNEQTGEIDEFPASNS